MRNSSYSGESNMGSSKKGKKNTSDKPKQPQRGLGVAQLEKIRLNGQLSSNLSFNSPNYPSNLNQEDQMRSYSHLPSSSFSYSSSSSMASSVSYGYPPNLILGHEGTNIRYSDSQPSTNISSWSAGNNFLEAQYFGQPVGSTEHLLNLQVEDVTQPRKTKKNRSNSMGSSSHNSESSDTQELDLELRLSL